MSKNNIGPLIALAVRDVLDGEKLLDVDSVYQNLINRHGNEIFEHERLLAQAAVKQKVKSYIRNAHRINKDTGGDQLSFLKDDAPATVSVKQKQGGYAYVPLSMAMVADLEAATKAKRDNIDNAAASFKRWNDALRPALKIMRKNGATFGEAQKIIAEAAAVPKKASDEKPKTQRRRAKA